MPLPFLGDDAGVNAINLLLHELRTPVSVAQGYLRLLLEDRLVDADERRRAIGKAMEALGRVSSICGEAGDLAAGEVAEPSSRYPAAELLSALRAAAGARALTVAVGDASGYVRTCQPEQAAAAIAGLVWAVTRGEPRHTPCLSAGVHGAEVVVTSGDGALRAQLLSAPRTGDLNHWRGGTGLLVPLAVRRLREAGAHVWALPDDPAAVAIALPMESDL